MKKALILLFFTTLSCSNEDLQEEYLLDRIENVVWTRGSNFKVFKNNPFRLILVEEGFCIEFSEAPKLIEGNEFQYTLLENGKDTLRLEYRVTGQQVNHCGTFNYFIDAQGELIRNYVECGAFYKESLRTNFYKAEQSLSTLCPDL